MPSVLTLDKIALRARQLRQLRASGVLSLRTLALVMSLQAARVLTETFGVALLFPLLKFVEQRQDIEKLASTSRLWQSLRSGFGALGLPVNLITLSAAIFVLVVFRQVIVYYAVLSADVLKERVTERLRKLLFHTVLDANATWLRQARSAHLVTALSQHAQSTGSLVRNSVNLFTLALSAALYGSMLIYAAPAVTICAAILGVVAARAMRRFADLARQTGRRATKLQQDYNHYLQERLQGWRLIKLSDSLPREDVLHAAHADALRDVVVQRTRETGPIQLILTPVVMAVVLFGLYYGVEKARIGLAELTIFVVVFLRLVPILEQFLKARQAFANIEGAAVNVEQLWHDSERQREVRAGGRRFAAPEIGIHFENVSYSYDGLGGLAINNVTASIPAGKTTAIVGPSGAGKSTLVDLIPRLIEPTGGRVILDGTPATELELASLRAGIAYVSQSPLMFDDTVAANIRYGRPEASDEEVAEAARLAHADDFIGRMPKGLQTNIGEAGQRLSGGQRQRLALARAFLANAAILIFDEPTSALDYESEHAIRSVLRELRDSGKRTIILIAHRPSTIADADHILILKGGSLVAAGSPEHLRTSNAWYAEMLHGDASRTEAAEPAPASH